MVAGAVVSWFGRDRTCRQGVRWWLPQLGNLGNQLGSSCKSLPPWPPLFLQRLVLVEMVSGVLEALATLVVEEVIVIMAGMVEPMAGMGMVGLEVTVLVVEAVELMWTRPQLLEFQLELV